MCYNKHMKKVLYKNHFQTPIGEMLSISDYESLYLLEFVERKNLKKKIDGLGADLEERPTFVSRLVEEEVQEYFSGIRKEFDLPLVFP
ncbi:MAG TPA: methylated-DNA--[protein]-cysteine S-methyltransferase, partial [Lactococcus sp.]|nr:methylated-DNA--[protein]-cysteine S-methyltransferase [Lactococcus sp.]